MCNKFGAAAITIVQFILLFILTTVISSCLVVPYEPTPDVSVSGSHLSAREMIVRARPNQLLEQVSEVITEAETRIEIVDPITFTEVAFPGRDKGLLRLFEDGNCQRISRELGVDYLVLIGDMENDTLSEVDAMGWFIVFFGVTSGERETRLSATIIDIKNERPLHDISSSARGSYGAVGYAYLVGTGPDTDSSAIKGLGRKIADIISNNSASEIIRIAVLSVGKKVGTEKALEALQERAKGGDPGAQWEFYQQQPTIESIVWLCRAADQGNISARNELGKLYLFGSQEYRGFSGINKSISEACMWFHLAGQAVVAEDIETVQATRTQDIKNATERIKMSITIKERQQATDMITAWSLGQCRSEVFMVDGIVETEETKKMLALCSEADLGSVAARNELSKLYYFGLKGLPKDRSRSYMWDYLALEASGQVPSRPFLQQFCDSMTMKERHTAVDALGDWMPGQCETDLLGGISDNQ